MISQKTVHLQESLIDIQKTFDEFQTPSSESLAKMRMLLAKVQNLLDRVENEKQVDQKLLANLIGWRGKIRQQMCQNSPCALITMHTLR